MKLIRFVLFPFSIIYHLITAIRNLLFDIGLLKSISFRKPIIVVGNLNVGGTGKTPQIEYLIRLLKEDFKISVLSRGYKRKSKGFLVVNNSHFAENVGDEPLQFFKKFDDIIVAVDTNRTNGIQQLLKQKNAPEIILLDDAYQHRKIKAGFYILLTKYNDLFVDDFLLPTGNLRESRRGANRANVIIVTKCPENLSKSKQEKIVKKLNLTFSGDIFFTTISYNDVLKSNQNVIINTNVLSDYEILLITGIANPSPLLDYLKNKNCSFKHLNFPDHHQFTSKDLHKINRSFKEISSDKKIILTTEKDFVRLSEKIKLIYFIEIETKFVSSQNDFDDLMITRFKNLMI